MYTATRRKSKHFAALVLGALVLLTGCGSTAASTAPAGRSSGAATAQHATGSSNSATTPTIKVAVTRSLAEVGLIWGMQQRFAAANGIKVDPVVGTTYADSLRALTQGDVDAATIGYQNVAQLADENASGIKVVAGGWNTAQNLIARKGSGIENWSNLRGKTVGVIQGSYAYIMFMVAAKVHGVDLNKVNLVNAPVGAAAFKALKQGALDAYVIWSPLMEQAITEGVAYRPKGINITDTASLKNGSGVIAVTPKLLKDTATLDKFLKALTQTADYYDAHPNAWASLAVKVTGANAAATKLAVRDGNSLDYHIVKASLLGAAKYGPVFGYTKKNDSATVASYIDLKPLAKVLGVTPLSLWQ